MLKGDTKSFEVLIIWELEVLAIQLGGTTSFHPLKRGRAGKVLPCLEGGGGGRKKFWIHNFPILYPPPSLRIDNSGWPPYE